MNIYNSISTVREKYNTCLLMLEKELEKRKLSKFTFFTTIRIAWAKQNRQISGISLVWMEMLLLVCCVKPFVTSYYLREVGREGIYPMGSFL